MFKKFKEDTTQLTDIEGLLKGKVNGNVIKHEIRPLTEFGENFGSEILRVEITVEENGQQKVLHAVAKLIPPTEMQLEIFNTQITFKNEVNFFATIAPLLQDFQREHNFPEIAEYFPKLYGGRYSLKPNSDVVDNDAVILMENLAIEGFTNLDRFQGFDLQSTRQVLRVLANLQATAVALKLKKPDEFFSKVRPYLTQFKMPPVGDPPNDSVFVQIEPYLREHPGTANLIPKITKLLAKLRRKKFIKAREPWATIVHNDLWVNNIMVRQVNQDHNEIKMVDFQVIDYLSPTNDLIFFLFTSAQSSVLRYHFDKLLLYYYNEFVKTLKQCKVDLKEFSYESFQEELKEDIAFQIYHALFMFSIVFGPKGMPKAPGKVAEWNPNGKTNNLGESTIIPHHAGPPGQHGGPPGHHGGPSGQHGGPPEYHGGPPVHHGGPPVNHEGPPAHHAGPPGQGKPGDAGPTGPPPIQFSLECKEKLWFIVEEAAKRNWI